MRAALAMLVIGLTAAVVGAETSETSAARVARLEAEGRRLLDEAKDHLGRGETAAALPLLEASFLCFARVPDAWAAAWLRARTAACLRALGRLDEALEAYRDAWDLMAFERNGEDHEDLASIGSDWALALQASGRPHEAVELLRRCRALLERLGSPDGVVRLAVLTNLASLLGEIGREAEALPVHEEAIDLARRILGDDHPDLRTVLQNHARCLAALGRPSEALPVLAEALRGCLRLGGSAAEEATLRNNLALALLDLGRPAEARVELERALELRRGALGDAHPDVARSRMNLGGCDIHLGRFGEALLELREAVRIFREGGRGDRPECADALHDLGSALEGLGFQEMALRRYRQELAIYRRAYLADHPSIASALNQVAVSLVAGGEPERALPRYEEALAMRRRLLGRDHPLVSMSLANLGVCLADQGRLDEAVPLLEEAVETSRRTEDPELHLRLTALAGILLHRRGEARRAASLLEEAVAQVESLRRLAAGLDESDRASYFEHLRRFHPYEELAWARIELGAPEEALRALEAGRARSLLDLLERSRFDPLEEAASRARARGDEATIAQVERVRTAVRDAERAADRSSHELAVAAGSGEEEARGRELAAARGALREALRERAELVRDVVPLARPASPEEIRSGLAPGETFLLYGLTDHGGLALVLTREGGVTAHELRRPDGTAVDRDGLEREIDAYVERLADPGTKAEDLLEAGTRLHGTLVPEAMREAISRSDRLILVPHGPLHRLPFESLVVAPGTFWIDAGPPVAVVPSGTALLRCRARRAEAAGREPGPSFEVLALGDPAFRAKGLPRLPGSRREVKTVLRAWKKEGRPARALLGEEATRSRLESLAGDARILHLATHHLIDEETGEGRLALAPSGADDDGFLVLADVLADWRGRLRRCELVVLSGCETGRGPTSRDEGVLALPYGFLHAGAAAVLATLWRVDDDSAAELMGELHRRLARGESALTALSAARRALRRSRPAPCHWAPFLFIGDPR